MNGLYGLAFVCFIGACLRFVFYRLIGRKDITMKYLTGKKDEQQITSLTFGCLLLFFFGLTIFIVSRE